MAEEEKERYVSQTVATETAQVAYDNDEEEQISDHELLCRIANDVRALKKHLVE